MSVSVTILARRYLNPAAGVTIDVDYPVFDESHVRVIYGLQGLPAVLDTDFTVTLNTTDFSDFQVTPTASLRTKIDAMIAADPTEVDQIVVRRSMPLTTDMTATLARLRDQIALEFDRTVLRAQEVDDKINGAIRVPDTEVETIDMTLPPVATRGTKFLVFNADGTPASSNRTLAEVEAAPDAEQAKIAAETAQAAAEAARDEAVAAGGKVKVSANDTTADDLEAKLLASGLAGLSTQNDGGNETRTVDVPVASQAEAEAGLGNTKAMTPARVKQAIAALGGSAPQTFFKNRLINGVGPYLNFRGPQTAMSNGDYFVDRWAYISDAGSAVVNGAVLSHLGKDYVGVDVTTADAVLPAGSNYIVRQRIEGVNVADFLIGTADAKRITLSFKSAHSKTGTYCVAFLNEALNRSYVAEYTQSVANAEENHAITLDLDTAGVWLTGANETGLDVSFCLGAGATYQTTPDSWSAGRYHATSNQVNAMDSTSNFFRLRDIQLELGDTATEPEIVDRETVRARCARYFQSSYTESGASDQLFIRNHQGSGVTYFEWIPFQPMARTPAVALTNISYSSGSNALVAAVREHGFSLAFLPSAANGILNTDYEADAEL